MFYQTILRLALKVEFSKTIPYQESAWECNRLRGWLYFQSKPEHLFSIA
jgi:hypothetical protein